MPDFEEFIIAGQSNLLRPLLDILDTDPEVAVGEVVNNAMEQPERFVVSMEASRAQALGQALPQLIVEPNDPLNL